MPSNDTALRQKMGARLRDACVCVSQAHSVIYIRPVRGLFDVCVIIDMCVFVYFCVFFSCV